MAEWIAEGEPSLDLWEMDIRRFGAQYRSPAYTHARIRETYETYYDIRYPNHERSAGRPLRMSPATPWHADHDAAFGEKSGWERVNWYEFERGRWRRVAAPARLGRPALVAGDRRRARRDARRRGDLRRVVVREDGDRGPGRRGPARAALRQPRRARRRPDHLHADAQPARRDRVRLHRRPARRGAVLDRHRDRVRQPRPRMDPQAPAGRRQRPGARHHLGLGLLRDLGPAVAGRAGAADPAGPLQRRLPLHVGARDHRRQRPGARAARHLRRRARLGDLLPHRVRARALARAVGGGRAARHRRRRLPGDRLDAAREGLPRLGRRHHPGRDAV